MRRPDSRKGIYYKTGPFGIEEYADDISVALNAAGIEKAHYSLELEKTVLED